MRIETERLALRPWREDDAEVLYGYAKDPRVGPVAGWRAHTSVENSREIIKTVLSVKGTYALTLKGGDEPIGSIGIFPVTHLSIPEYEGELEIGYWIAVPFWGRGLIPEAVREVLRRAFDEGNGRIWCGHYEGNDRSRRVIVKCGFRFFIKQETDVPLMGERRMTYFYYITRDRFRREFGQ